MQGLVYAFIIEYLSSVGKNVKELLVGEQFVCQGPFRFVRQTTSL